MRIIHVIDFFQPQLGYQETYLAREQIKNGNIVRVITSDRYSSIMYKGCALKQILGDRKKGPGQFNEEGINVIRLPSHIEFLTNLWLSGLEKNIIDFNPDVIHIHGLSSITAVRVARLKKKMRGTKLIFDDHMTFNALRGKYVLPLYSLFRYFFCDTILSNADGIVAVTQETKQFMEKIYGIPSDRIDIIPLGCDTSRFHRDEFWRKTLRNDLDIKINEIVFCYAGKIIRDKGVDILINAALELAVTNDNIKILCIGGRDTTYFESLQEMVNKSEFKNKFVFIPAVPNIELYKYYSVADVGIWPKQCSLTMLEAMACGLPTITSDNSGALERTINCKTGYVYEEGNIGDLKNKMELFLNKDTLKDMSRNARDFTESINWKKINLSFENLYAGDKTYLRTDGN